MSDTTDLFTGTSGEPEEPSAPSSCPAMRRLGGRAGTSPAPTGAVRSWAGYGLPCWPGRLRPEAQPPRGTGLSAMLLPELQRLAQSLGIPGTARMRKGELIAAIEERQRGGEANQAARPRTMAGHGGAAAAERPVAGSQGANHNNSVQRGAPAGAGATRPFEQDAMEFETSTQPGLGSASCRRDRRQFALTAASAAAGVGPAVTAAAGGAQAAAPVASVSDVRQPGQRAAGRCPAVR